MTLRVVAHFRILPDACKDVLPHLQGLVHPTREEDGCITYVPLLDINDSTHVVFVEEWRDRRAFEQHSLSAELRRVLSIVEPLLSEPIVAYELSELDHEV